MTSFAGDDNPEEPADALQRLFISHNQVMERLFGSEQEKRAILDSMTDRVVYLDRDLRVVWANAAARQAADPGLNEINGRFCHRVWHDRRDLCEGCPVVAALETGRPAHSLLHHEDGRNLEVKGIPVKDTAGRTVGAIETVTDISGRLRMENSLKASHRFLGIANRHWEMRSLLTEYAAEIHRLTECDAVGIRIVDEYGYMPYMASIGFDRGFFEMENALSADEDACMCARVVWGGDRHPLPFYDRGTFVANRTSALLDSLSPSDRKHIRCLCNAFGFESLALVPISLEQQVLGLIQVADRKRDRIPPFRIRQLEDAAMQLGAAIQRIRAEEHLWKAYAKLEDRVQERTAELVRINRKLRQEIEERKKTEAALKLDESRLETLYHLNQMGDSSHQEICDFVVEQGVLLTQSEFGYLFFMNEQETILTVHSWSAAAMAICTVPGRPCVYRVVDTGLWGDAVRLRRPVITNDYEASLRRRGLPDGHVPIRRHMNIPVFDDEKIVAVAGVANKAKDYGDKDVRQLELLMKGMWRYIQRKKAQEALQASEEKLRQLTTQLLAAQEKERKRISIELHDELGQGLLTLKLQLRAMERKLSDQQNDLRADFQHVFRHINSVTEDVRRLSRDLSPSILEDLGLVAALHWLIKRIGKHHYIVMRCDIDALEGVYAPEKELILFRIFQEALTNVAKHAHTRHAEIRAEPVGDGFVLTIEDQGRGFDPERVLALKASDRGLGLAAMDERVRMLGGELEIVSRDSGGTRLRIAVPSPSPIGE